MIQGWPVRFARNGGRVVLNPDMEGRRGVLRRLACHRDGGKRIAAGDGAAARPCARPPPPSGTRRIARPPSLGGRPVGAFTPAVSDPRLAAALARRGTSINSDFRFTPADGLGERSRGVRVAVRARAPTRWPTPQRAAVPDRGLAGHRDHAQLLQSRRLGRLAALRHLRRRRPGRWRPDRRHPRIGAGRDELSRHPPPHRPGRGRRRARRGQPAHRRRRTRPIRSTSAAPSRSPATSMSPPAPATASRATGSSRSPRRPPRQPGRLCRHRLPLLSVGSQASIPRPAISAERGEPACRARCVHPAERDHRQRRARAPARRSAPRPSGRASGMAAGREDRRQEEQGGAVRARRRGSRRRSWTGALRRPAPRPAAVAAVGAPGPRLLGRAGEQQQAARARARTRVEQVAPRDFGEAVVAKHDAGALRAAAPTASNRPSPCRSSVISQRRGRGWRARIALPIAAAMAESSLDEVAGARIAKAAALAGREPGEVDPDRRLQDPARRSDRGADRRRASAISARIGCRRRRPSGRRCARAIRTSASI